MIVVFGMPLEEVPQLHDLVGLLARLGERHVDVVVEDDDEARPRPAKSRIRSSAGFRRLAVSPAIFDETNSLWMVNSPMPEKTPGKVFSTRRMWSAAYMSAG